MKLIRITDKRLLNAVGILSRLRSIRDTVPSIIIGVPDFEVNGGNAYIPMAHIVNWFPDSGSALMEDYGVVSEIRIPAKYFTEIQHDVLPKGLRLQLPVYVSPAPIPPEPAPVVVERRDYPYTFEQLLEKELETHKQRGAQRDSPSGERSMSKIVQIFNIAEGTNLTEVQGWRFMQDLKRVRCVTGEFDIDDYIDMANYANLAGEAGSNGR